MAHLSALIEEVIYHLIREISIALRGSNQLPEEEATTQEENITLLCPDYAVCLMVNYNSDVLMAFLVGGFIDSDPYRIPVSGSCRYRIVSRELTSQLPMLPV